MAQFEEVSDCSCCILFPLLLHVEARQVDERIEAQIIMITNNREALGSRSHLSLSPNRGYIGYPELNYSTALSRLSGYMS